MADYVENIVATTPGETPESVKAGLAKTMTWKKDDVTMDDVKRVYLKTYRRNSRAESFASGGHPVMVNLFVDDDGAIVGWDSRE
jgi:hypothetical protein